MAPDTQHPPLPLQATARRVDSGWHDNEDTQATATDEHAGTMTMTGERQMTTTPLPLALYARGRLPPTSTTTTSMSTPTPLSTTHSCKRADRTQRRHLGMFFVLNSCFLLAN
ncbi:hypothetical protein L208DRAFT_605039 [Tricholoma matsutake]|nr:hypothetical protein L208DRAFT_605039 [Tricholoma matsutake 945]